MQRQLVRDKHRTAAVTKLARVTTAARLVVALGPLSASNLKGRSVEGELASVAH